MYKEKREIILKAIKEKKKTALMLNQGVDTKDIEEKKSLHNIKTQIEVDELRAGMYLLTKIG